MKVENSNWPKKGSRVKRGILGRVVAVLMLAVWVQGAIALAASADTPGCWRGTCTGKDPFTMGCDADAEVLDQVEDGSVVEVKLVWSPTCQATWTKVTIDPSYESPVFGTHWYTPTLGGVQEAYPTPTPTFANPSVYSLMGNWKATNKACFNDVDEEYDPAPIVLDPGTVAPPLSQHGLCTNWI